MRITTTPPRAWQFAGWTVVGGLGCLGLLTALSIGPYVLVLGLLGIGTLVLTGGANESALGLVSGAGLPLLYVAWLNRAGPGNVCHSIRNGQACTEEWSPWPWAAAGLVVIAAGIALYAVVGRKARVTA